MKYNFDEIIERSGSNSVKYDERLIKFKRKDILPLWVADMDFQVPKPVIDALVKRAEHGIFGYVSHSTSYKQAACDFMKRRHDWTIRPEEISFCTGVVSALSQLVREFTSPGDRVLIQTPVYPQFYHVIEAWEREVLENPLINDAGYYRIDFEDLEQKMKQSPKLLILCNPHNPVGRIWTKEELNQMGELCLKYKVRLISDEIHGDIELFGNKYTPTANLSEAIRSNTITCFSATKTFNLAGLQACCIWFPNQSWKESFDAFWRKLDIQRNNCFSLVAMETAWNEGEEWLDQMIEYVEHNMIFAKNFIDQYIPSIKVHLPEATYLLWLDCSDLNMNPQQLEEFMVQKAGIGLNNGNNFCRSLEGFMRMNLACPRIILSKALNQMKEAIENHLNSNRI